MAWKFAESVGLILYLGFDYRVCCLDRRKRIGQGVTKRVTKAVGS